MSSITSVICFIFFVAFVHNVRPQTIEHEPNLIWAQAPFLRAFSNTRLMAIKGDPSKWVSSKQPKQRHIRAPHFTWEFKSLAFHWEDMQLFWSEVTYKKIQSLYLNGSLDTATLFRGTSAEVHGLAVDWLSRNLYYTDALYNWIIMGSIIPNKPGYKIVVQTELDAPHGIAVDPIHRYLFWSDWGRRPKIERSTLLGNARRIILDKELVKPQGLAVDYSGNGALYWVDAFKCTLETSDLNGNNHKILALEEGTKLYGVALYKNFIFVTEQNHSLLKVYTNKSSVISYGMSGATPWDIIMYDQSRQPTQSDACVNADCDQICMYTPGPNNTDGTARCLCGEGYKPVDDTSKSCKHTERFVHPSHFYAIGDSICHYPANMADMPLDNLTLGTQCFLGEKNTQPGYTTLAFDASENMLYYFSNFTKTIARLPLEVGAKASVVEGGTGIVKGMSLDWVSGNLYWTDSTHRNIMVSKKTGLYQKVLIERLGTPVGIAVHPGRSEIYWSDHGHLPDIPASVEKARADGTGREVVMKGDVTEPNHLFIDFTTESLYWTDSTQNHVRKLNLETGRITVVYEQDNVKFYGISVFSDYLVWTDTEDLNGIHMARMDTKEKVRGIIHPNIGIASDVVTFDGKNQPHVYNPCDENLTPCTQLCLASVNQTYTCYCGLGYTLQADGYTCHSSPVQDEFLLVNDGFQKKIFQVDLNSGQVQAVDLNTGNMAIGVAYDPNNDRVYWSDNTVKEIKRATVSGQYQSTVMYFNSSTVCDGIAADYVNQLLFYTDTGNNIIGVVSFDHLEHYAEILTDNLDQPRDIVVSPKEGLIYWSDWGRNPGIERANMDGTERTILYTPDNGTKAWINGLALDIPDSMLYWVDAYSDTISVLNLTSGETTILISTVRTHFFAIDVVGDYIYVSDWMKNVLQRMPKSGGELTQFGPSNFTRLYGIQGYNSSQRFEAFSKCAYSACEHLCLPRANGPPTCRCSKGYMSFNYGINCEKVIITTPSTTPPYHIVTTNAFGNGTASTSPSGPLSSSPSTTSSPPTPPSTGSSTTSGGHNTDHAWQSTEPYVVTLTHRTLPVTMATRTGQPTMTPITDNNINYSISPGSSSTTRSTPPSNNKGTLSKSTSKGSSGGLKPVTVAAIACGIALFVIIVILIIVYRKKYSYRVNHGKLVEDPSNYYQIAFDGARNSVTLDSGVGGIENPTYDYLNQPTTEDQ